MAFTLLTPAFSLVAGITLAKKPQLVFHLIIFGSVLVLVSTVLLSRLPVDAKVWNAEYGAEVLMGAGFGIAAPAQYFVLKLGVKPEDLCECLLIN